MNNIQHIRKGRKYMLYSVQDRNKDIFVHIYRTHYYNLCYFTFKIIGDSEVAKELVQDTFLAVWEKRKQLKSPNAIQSYIYKALKNRALDYLKHQKVVRRWLEEANNIDLTNVANSDEEISEDDLSHAIDQSVDNLPSKCKMIFKMSRNEGLTYNEIADLQGISVKTVETQMRRAFTKLRDTLYMSL